MIVDDYRLAVARNV